MCPDDSGNDPKSGKLVAVLIPKMSVFKALPATRSLFRGELEKSKHVEYIFFKSLKITRRAKGLVQYDGETFEGGKTLDVSVEPSSLNVITP